METWNTRWCPIEGRYVGPEYRQFRFRRSVAHPGLLDSIGQGLGRLLGTTMTPAEWQALRQEFEMKFQNFLGQLQEQTDEDAIYALYDRFYDYVIEPLENQGLWTADTIEDDLDRVFAAIDERLKVLAVATQGQVPVPAPGDTRRVLKQRKSSFPWPWVIGGAAVVGTVATVAVLRQRKKR